MIELLRRLWWFYRVNQKRKTHPHIKNSWVENLDRIDPTARICDSQVYGTVELGNRCVIDNCHITANSVVSIGRCSILTGPVRIVGDLNPVEVGKFCSIAPNVGIWESLHDHQRMTTYCILGEFFKNPLGDLTSKGPVRIGNDVWIGTRSVILSGVTIGDGSVIGAGSVVINDIPPYSIAAGIPAAPLRSRFPAEQTRLLQELKWWNWDDQTILRNHNLWGRPFTPEMFAELCRQNTIVRT